MSGECTAVSYACGESGPPLFHRTIGAILEDACTRNGSRLALISRQQNIRWTYQELLKRVNSLAAGFIALGLKPGERIGIWSPNNAEWVLTQFAAAKAGLILVTVNPAYRVRELEFALNQVSCAAIVVAAPFKTSNFVELLRSVVPELNGSVPGQLRAERLPGLRHAIYLGSEAQPGFTAFSDILCMGNTKEYTALEDLAWELQPDDPINIQFTSGTTGSPKGATLTHSNIINNGFQVAERIKLTSNDRLCVPVPLYHCFGMVMGVLGAVTHGSTIVLPGPAFDVKQVLDAVTEERCTALYGVPTMFIAELNDQNFASYDFSNLRTGIMAGAPCPIDIMKRVIADMNMREITICYGMTETSPVSFQSAVDDPIERRVSTVGHVHPYVEAKIIDSLGRTVPLGQPGELLTRGYNVMLYYWNEEEKTREVIDCARWMHTGDLATMDAEGCCNIVGRAKDMIVRGGENVYPREVEDFLYSHPKIQSVQVFGIPDNQWGERVCAWVVLHRDVECSTEEIAQYCRGQIAHYKIPSYIEFVEAFPLTVTGKVQKYLMRAQVTERLGILENRTA